MTIREAYKKTLPTMFYQKSDEFMAKCPSCMVLHQTTHRYGYCPPHQLCTVCGKNPWMSEDKLRCADCLCNECWELWEDLQEDETSGKYVCKRCRSKPTCEQCGRKSPRYIARKNKKFFNWCGNCLHFKQLQCSFCFARASGFIADAHDGTTKTGCNNCQNSYCCFKAKCTPTHQCPSCQSKQLANEINHEDEQTPTSAPFQKRPVVFWMPKNAKDRTENKFTRFAGIEIEVAGFNHSTANYNLLRKVSDMWSASIVRDGSLPNGGIEINLSPAAGNLLFKQIDDWCEALRQVGAFVNNQCGLHIHVDARDHTIEDLKKLIRYYAFLEPALIRTQPYARVMVGNQQNGRKYCSPCGQEYVKELDQMSSIKSAKIYTQAVKQKLLDNIYGEGQGRAPKREHYASAKYHAFNMHSFFYRDRKTVESRLHTGTILPRKIKDWALLWINIIDHAYKTPEKKLPFSGSVDDSIAELLKIAPTPRCEAYLKTRIKEFREQYDVALRTSLTEAAVTADPSSANTWSWGTPMFVTTDTDTTSILNNLVD